MTNVTGKELNAYYDDIVSMMKKIMESTDIDYTHKDLMMYLIENIVKCIANNLSFEASYKTNGEVIKSDIQLTNNVIEDEDEDEEEEGEEDELSKTIKTINEKLNKIVDDFDSDDAAVALTHILNICEPIACDTSFMSIYKTNDEGIESAIKLIDSTDSKIPLLKELSDHVSTLDDDDFWRHVRTKKVDEDAAPFKLKSQEAHIIDVMMDRLSDRINSVDCEVEAIKDHLTELGLGLDATCDNAIEYSARPCDCDECSCDEEPKLHKPLTYRELVDKVHDGVLTTDDKFDIVADGLIELLDRTLALEAFCSQVCDTIAADKKLSKTFNKCAEAKNKKYKAIKAVKKATE